MSYTVFPSCCKDCQNRAVGCHSTCEEYHEAKTKYDSDNQQIKRDRQGNYQAWEMRKECIEKTKRRCHDRKEKKR